MDNEEFYIRIRKIMEDEQKIKEAWDGIAIYLKSLEDRIAKLELNSLTRGNMP